MATSATAAPLLLLAEAGNVVPAQNVQVSPESFRQADSLRNEGECMLLSVTQVVFENEISHNSHITIKLYIGSDVIAVL
jgi:hypothetical protein